MKTLEINAYGVQEMNKQEMVETEGGILPLVIAAIVVVGAVASGCVKVDRHVEININSNNGNETNTAPGSGNDGNASNNGSGNTKNK